MADIKWIKLATGMPDDEKMKLIDAMPERDTVHYLWIRFIIQAGKTNADGEIFLSEGIPYTDKMLAVIFSRPLASIKLALKTLSRLGMIEIAPNKVIRIVNWDKHQSIEGMERVRDQNRKRVENHREKKKQDEKAAKDNKQEIEDVEELEENNILDNLEESLNTNDEDITCESSNASNENKKSKKKIKTEGNIEEVTGEAEKRGFENISHVEINDDTNIITDNNNLNDTAKITTDNNKNDFNTTKETCNVTQNESNVTVTEQNKKEIENKNKKEKKEIDKDKDKDIKSKKNNACDVNNKNLTCSEEVSHSSLFENNNTKSESAAQEDINIKAMELMHYHEKITEKVGGCDYVALRSAINLHGEKWVKMAMDVGFERNCPDIKYAIGILKNWRRDGYPKDDMEVKTNGFRSTGKSNTADKNEFTGFKPKEPRKLTEAERKKADANLI